MKKKKNDGMIDIDQLLTFKCPEGHIYGMSFRDFESGKRCPVCAKNKIVNEVIEEIRKTYDGTILTNVAMEGIDYIIDIYMPEINKAINIG